jgi:hypothetical protein
VNIQAATIAQACINMVIEAILVALPMPTLYKLKTTVQKKLQILVLFSLGLIVVIICILRIAALIQDYGIANITWHAWEQGLWDAAEVYVSIICVCLPAGKVAWERIGKWWAGVRKSRAGADLEGATAVGAGVDRGVEEKSGLGFKMMWEVLTGKGGRKRRERLPSMSRNTITKRTSTTISWSHFGESTAVGESLGATSGEGGGAKPEWAAGWESGEVARSYETRITGGNDNDRSRGLRSWFGAEGSGES